MDLLWQDEWITMARRAWSAGDINNARMCYQKAAYGYKHWTPEQNDQFRSEMADFVQEDPVYEAVMKNVLEHLEANPGTIQANVGKLMDDDSRELFNYALYFGAVCGTIVRVKSGRSYKLYLPDQIQEPAP